MGFIVWDQAVCSRDTWKIEVNKQAAILLTRLVNTILVPFPYWLLVKDPISMVGAAFIVLVMTFTSIHEQ